MGAVIRFENRLAILTLSADGMVLSLTNKASILSSAVPTCGLYGKFIG